MSKEFAYNAGDTGDAGLMPGLGRSLVEGNGNPLQYPCLGNPTDRGGWQVSLQGCKKLDMTKQLSMHTHIYRNRKYIGYL